MCNQNESDAEVAADGTLTVCQSVSVCVVPYPLSQAFHDPECGG